MTAKAQKKLVQFGFSMSHTWSDELFTKWVSWSKLVNKPCNPSLRLRFCMSFCKEKSNDFTVHLHLARITRREFNCSRRWTALSFIIIFDNWLSFYSNRMLPITLNSSWLTSKLFTVSGRCVDLCATWRLFDGVISASLSNRRVCNFCNWV